MQYTDADHSGVGVSLCCGPAETAQVISGHLLSLWRSSGTYYKDLQVWLRGKECLNFLVIQWLKWPVV